MLRWSDLGIELGILVIRWGHWVGIKWLPGVIFGHYVGSTKLGYFITLVCKGLHCSKNIVRAGID
jgi:hypothetical protein